MLEAMGSADEVEQATREYRELQAAKRKANTAFDAAKEMAVKVVGESDKLNKHSFKCVGFIGQIYTVQETLAKLSQRELSHVSRISLIEDCIDKIESATEKLRKLL